MRVNDGMEGRASVVRARKESVVLLSRRRDEDVQHISRYDDGQGKGAFMWGRHFTHEWKHDLRCYCGHRDDEGYSEEGIEVGGNAEYNPIPCISLRLGLLDPEP